MGRQAGLRRVMFLMTWSAWAVASSHAVTLTDGNSVADFNPATQQGQFDWIVDGVNQLKQQWFWYRIGNTPEASIDTISAPVINQPGPDQFDSTYTNPLIRIKTGYTLIGGSAGSHSSTLNEQIRITNLTGTTMPFSFFEYVDLDLGGTPADLTVYFSNPNTAHQADFGSTVSETAITDLGAINTFHEVNFWPNTLTTLNDGLPSNLNGNVGPIGPGDLTWAFQWDFLIPAGQTVLISKGKSLVPEPSTLILLAVSGCLFRRRRQAV
jgi:hypothetical protein